MPRINHLRFLVSYAWHKVFGGLHKSRGLNAAFGQRDWERFEELISDPQLSDSLKLVWGAMRSDYFQELDNPAADWLEVNEKLTRRGHFLSYLAFQNYLNGLIAIGSLEQFKLEFSRQHREFMVPLPLSSVASAGALFIREQDFAGCLRFFDHIRGTLPSEKKSLFDLKSFAYRWISKQQLNELDQNGKANLSVELVDFMRNVFQPGSPAMSVLETSQSCWKAIGQLNPSLLLELRYQLHERQKLRELVLSALREGSPLLFLRLGDGEAYAFYNEATEQSALFRDHLELLWWGRTLPEGLRKDLSAKVQETLGAADIIGLPSAPRLAQVLHQFTPGALSEASRKQQGLFMGVEENVKNGNISCKCWVDEYANYAFVDSVVLEELIATAKNVVVVGCFEIPENHALDNQKVTLIPIPPVQKVSTAKGLVSASGFLPDIIVDLQLEIEPLLERGSLLLLAAGFAGKPLLLTAKKQGAVALDFGSGLDHVLGYKTRSPELTHLFS